MKILTLDEKNGDLFIDGSKIDLSSCEAFTKLVFLESIDGLTSFGKYRFFLNEVSWHNEPFTVEFNPAVFSFKGLVCLTSKTGDFYKSFSNWDKRANVKALKEEQNRMLAWMLNKYPSNYEGELKEPPYGNFWSFEWGEITVQSNERSFDCGIYIVRG
ncbi:hypothetical protein [Pantoea anthophila]|uniref:hypothetical protein n=1 Tax=Pantoea anthophila TaxID=470931 RepID=UPI00111F6264|nr:hypothetical protein [Pantoea anthophila]MEB6222037.1 hypothetical protein [Pantoea anthophila]TPE19201.1 hypothetical protein FJP62_03900 [Pantoea vagans]